jgi:hypothetical protein
VIGFAATFGDPCTDRFDQTIQGIEVREQLGSGSATPEETLWARWIGKSGNFRDNDCRDYYISLYWSKKRAKDMCKKLKSQYKLAKFYASDKATKHFAYETSVSKLQKDRDEAQDRLEFCQQQAVSHIDRSPFSLFVAPVIGGAVVEQSSPPYMWLLVGGGALFLAYAIYQKKKRTKT